ncbi:hypothetical protein [Salmonella enterica]|uniref:hypothetical protein n=1 Tax=Salmonella enterica TaxID=28901 RepID=UPI001F432CAF|nr:hypothetical protein [Salmonella enterica]
MNQYNSSIPKFIVSVFLIVTGFFSSTIKAQELKLMIKINEAVFMTVLQVINNSTGIYLTEREKNPH